MCVRPICLTPFENTEPFLFSHDNQRGVVFGGGKRNRFAGGIFLSHHPSPHLRIHHQPQNRAGHSRHRHPGQRLQGVPGSPPAETETASRQGRQNGDAGRVRHVHQQVHDAACGEARQRHADHRADRHGQSRRQMDGRYPQRPDRDQQRQGLPQEPPVGDGPVRDNRLPHPFSEGLRIFRVRDLQPVGRGTAGPAEGNGGQRGTPKRAPTRGGNQKPGGESGEMMTGAAHDETP